MFSKEKLVVAYTVERCKSCSFEKKREFKEGDYLFLDTDPCSSCKGIMQIEKIFGESIEQ